jgi:beta-phosphoglucomutase
MRINTWALEQHTYIEEELARSESLFSIGNGYLGFRGFFFEREVVHHPGVFINGFYETSPIHYGEDAYGFARLNQTMLDLPDCRFTKIVVDGQKFSFSSKKISSFSRILDFRSGILNQSVIWETNQNKIITIKWQTLLSMVDKHTGAIKIEVNCSEKAHIEFISSIAMPKSPPVTALDPRVSTRLSESSLVCVEKNLTSVGQSKQIGFQASFKTKESGLYLVMGCAHHSSKQSSIESTNVDPFPTIKYSFEDFSADLTKCFYYHSSGRVHEELNLDEVRSTNINKGCTSWATLVASQKEYYKEFWDEADVVIDGDDKLQQAIRFNLFQLLQSVGKDGSASLAAKGLTGGGYEGHYFWDTEIYGMPFFTHIRPSIARSLLDYRISLLEHARTRAREMNQKGALYPWRTINGMEASAYYPAGTAQYHINADIAYSLYQYIDVTGDNLILKEGGFELLFETARLYLDLGFFNKKKGGAFCINEVTGPDEYSALVDNNFYTNMMVKYHLARLYNIVVKMQTSDPKLYSHFVETLKIEDGEVESFNKAASMMYLPYDYELGIDAQDDRFLSLQKWEGEMKRPLLLNYHPLVIYRHQVIKQADTILANFLLSQYTPWYQKKRNYDFYDPLTTGDSSLSDSIHALVAFDLGYEQKALEYTTNTTLMDIEDLHRNTKDGLHTAAMAGSWMTMVYGVAGYRLINNTALFRPKLPSGWNCLSFKLRFKETLLKVEIKASQTTYQTEGPKLKIKHFSNLIEVGSKKVVVSTKPSCKGVIFDLDGVITSTDNYHYQAWKKIADDNNWYFDETINQQLRGVSRIDSLKIILKHNNVALDDQKLIELTDQKNSYYRTSLENLTPDNILEGIEDLLKELKKNKIKTAIASVSQNALFILEKLNLKNYFDVVVPAATLIKGKNDPEVFVKAAESLNLFVEECSGIEDAQAGIEAVRKANMKVIGVGEAVNKNECDEHVDDTSQLTYEMVTF